MLRLAVSRIEGLKSPLRSSKLVLLKSDLLLASPSMKLLAEGGSDGLLVFVGDLALVETEDSLLVIPGKLGLEDDAEGCWPIWLDELVLAIEPLFIKLDGKSPNLGNANWKSLEL